MRTEVSLSILTLEQIAALKDQVLALATQGNEESRTMRLAALDTLVSPIRERACQASEIRQWKTQQRSYDALEALLSRRVMRTRPQDFDEIIDVLGRLVCSAAAREDRGELERLVFLLKSAQLASPSTRILKMIAIVSVMVLLEFAEVADQVLAAVSRLAARGADEVARPEPPLIRIPSIKPNAPNICA